MSLSTVFTIFLGVVAALFLIVWTAAHLFANKSQQRPWKHPDHVRKLRPFHRDGSVVATVREQRQRLFERVINFSGDPRDKKDVGPARHCRISDAGTEWSPEIERIESDSASENERALFLTQHIHGPLGEERERILADNARLRPSTPDEHESFVQSYRNLSAVARTPKSKTTGDEDSGERTDVFDASQLSEAS